MHRFPLLTLIAAASLILGTACDGSSPLAPGENGNTDLPGTGSGFHESGAIQSASPSASDPSGVTIVLGGDVRVQVGDETVAPFGTSRRMERLAVRDSAPFGTSRRLSLLPCRISLRPDLPH